jgi:hypothetical protein
MSYFMVCHDCHVKKNWAVNMLSNYLPALVIDLEFVRILELDDFST